MVLSTIRGILLEVHLISVRVMTNEDLFPCVYYSAEWFIRVRALMRLLLD